MINETRLTSLLQGRYKIGDVDGKPFYVQISTNQWDVTIKTDERGVKRISWIYPLYRRAIMQKTPMKIKSLPHLLNLNIPGYADPLNFTGPVDLYGVEVLNQFGYSALYAERVANGKANC